MTSQPAVLNKYPAKYPKIRVIKSKSLEQQSSHTQRNAAKAPRPFLEESSQGGLVTTSTSQHIRPRVSCTKISWNNRTSAASFFFCCRSERDRQTATTSVFLERFRRRQGVSSGQQPQQQSIAAVELTQYVCFRKFQGTAKTKGGCAQTSHT